MGPIRPLFEDVKSKELLCQDMNFLTVKQIREGTREIKHNRCEKFLSNNRISNNNKNVIE